jgi:hypothetical protein
LQATRNKYDVALGLDGFKDQTIPKRSACMQTNGEISGAKAERFACCIEQEKACTCAFTKACCGRDALGHTLDPDGFAIEHFSGDSCEMSMSCADINNAICSRGKRCNDSQERFDFVLFALRDGVLFAHSNLFVF